MFLYFLHNFSLFSEENAELSPFFFVFHPLVVRTVEKIQMHSVLRLKLRTDFSVVGNVDIVGSSFLSLAYFHHRIVVNTEGSASVRRTEEVKFSDFIVFKEALL